MRQTTLLLTLLTSVAFSTASPAEEKTYLEASTTPELLTHEGRKVIVYGHTEGSGKAASGTNFVNFKGSEFYLITFKSDLEQFKEGEPHELYDGKRLAVEGVLTVYQGKPQIKLTEPAQITELAADAVFPPPVAVVERPTSSAPEGKKEAETPSGEATPEEPKRKPPVDPREYFKP